MFVWGLPASCQEAWRSTLPWRGRSATLRGSEKPGGSKSTKYCLHLDFYVHEIVMLAFRFVRTPRNVTEPATRDGALELGDVNLPPELQAVAWECLNSDINAFQKG